MIDKKCIVWENEEIIKEISSREFFCQCIKCGDFKAEKEGEDKMIKLSKKEKEKLSIWIRNQNTDGSIPVFDNFINFDEILNNGK